MLLLIKEVIHSKGSTQDTMEKLSYLAHKPTYTPFFFYAQPRTIYLSGENVLLTVAQTLLHQIRIRTILHRPGHRQIWPGNFLVETLFSDESKLCQTDGWSSIGQNSVFQFPLSFVIVCKSYHFLTDGLCKFSNFACFLQTNSTSIVFSADSLVCYFFVCFHNFPLLTGIKCILF